MGRSPPVPSNGRGLLLGRRPIPCARASSPRAARRSAQGVATVGAGERSGLHVLLALKEDFAVEASHGLGPDDVLVEQLVLGVDGAAGTTVRKAVKAATSGQSNLLDAMREFPVEERGEINQSKLGWLLKKNANRIVGGFEFQQAEADGRNAWRVIAVKTPPLPALPPSIPASEKTVGGWSKKI